MPILRIMKQLTAVFLALAIVLAAAAGGGEWEILAEVRAGLDPGGEVLSSWVAGKNPCGGSFVGVACDSKGRVSNISLQGRGLQGSIPAALGELSALTALYLHYNSLTGTIPGAALTKLTGLTDVYLNVNKLRGVIPPQLASLPNIQALQLCCNELSGRIPDSLGHLGLLTLLALQHNHLQGRIPASLGQLTSLRHLDLSFNRLTGPIPAALNNLAQITVLDVRNNNLSGYVPPGLRTLQEGFEYSNNTGLCGQGFSNLPDCSGSGVSLHRPQQPFDAAAAVPPVRGAAAARAPMATFVQPQARPADDHQQQQRKQTHSSSSSSSSSSSKIPQMAVIGGVVAVTSGVLLALLMSFVWFRRHKQRISSTSEAIDKLAVVCYEQQQREMKKNKDMSPPGSKRLVAPLAMQSINAPKSLIGSSMRSFQYRLDELELATNYFSDKYLLARKSTMSIYRAVVRDGSTVVIKDYTKTRFVAGEEEFEAALSSLMQLKHENLVKLRGFCCVKGGLQCYLIYDHVPNGTLFEHLHGGTASTLDWGTRVHIAHGIAKGLDYLHRNGQQLLVWASNVFLDDNYNAQVSGWGLGKLLADEVVYGNIKTSAMLGYLAPEYGTLGHLNDKSDVYTFGMLLLELLTGRKPLYTLGSSTANLVSLVKPLLDCGQVNSVLDPSLLGKFSAAGALGMASIAFACVCAAPEQRPNMGQVVQRLYEIETLADGPTDAGFSSSGEEYPTRQQAAYAQMLDYGR